MTKILLLSSISLENGLIKAYLTKPIAADKLNKRLMEDGRNLAERTLGGSRIKCIDIDKVHCAGAKGFSAAEGLAYVEAGFELIEHQNELVFARFGQDVALAFLVVTQQHVAAILFFAHKIPGEKFNARSLRSLKAQRTQRKNS